jgi:hypothetical protein
VRVRRRAKERRGWGEGEKDMRKERNGKTDRWGGKVMGRERRR